MKIDFYHIKNEDKNVTPTIKCLKIENKLYPVEIDEEELSKPRVEVFVQGQGHKKISTKKLIDVPRFSMQTEDWENYLNTYGHHVLFFSLTNEQYGSMDCCYYHAHMEFNSVVGLHNIESYVDWLSKIRKLQELQAERLKEYEKKVRFPYRFIEKHLIIPYYTLSVPGVFGSIPFTPTVDPMKDEALLNHLFYSLKMTERDQEEDIFASDEEIRNLMKDEKEWPVSIKDKMVMMYGEEIARLYEECLDGPKESEIKQAV